MMRKASLSVVVIPKKTSVSQRSTSVSPNSVSSNTLSNGMVCQTANFHTALPRHCQNFKLKNEDYDRFFNCISRNREASLIRRMTDLQNKAPPETISLAGGFPNPNLFPFKDAVFNLKSGESLAINEQKFEHAQQYSPTSGYPPLLEITKEIVLRYHNPPNWKESRVAITAGSQDGFSRSLEMMISPGDYVIVEEPSFCGALSVMNPYRVKYLAVATDEFGMVPQSLRDVLSQWKPEEVRNAAEGVPKVIYVNPNGTNPTGVSLITERKKEIYDIARSYNFLILEDDPYYFLQFEDPKEYPESFLSMDYDGRVMRFDSFSKVVCSGFRVGYVTGPEKLVTKIVQHSEVTILHTASLSQVIINELLRRWSFAGLEDHMADVRKFYLSQREALRAAAAKHLTGLCEWNIPTGGMFLWLKVLNLEDTTEMILERALTKDLLLMPGNTFMVDEKKPCPYMRLSFSFSSPEAMDEGCRRLAELIREEIRLEVKNGNGRAKEASSI